MVERKKYPEKALSAVKVRSNLKPGRYADGGGLYLIVDPSGAKRWMLRTVVRRKRCDIGLGGISVVSLAEARDEAAKLRKIARAGGDPLSERQRERRVVPTFTEAAIRLHESLSKAFRNDKHRGQWIDSLQTYADPFFGDRRVDQIESGDVLKALGAIWMEKPETARRVRQRIKAVFEWAKASGFRSGDNPVDGVSKVLPKHKTAAEHFAALAFSQVPAFVQELRHSDAGMSVKLAFELMILTITRTSEVQKACWAEIDLEEKTWTIPAARMKAGREHRIPLAPRAVEILEEALKIADGGEYVFPGRSAKRPLSNTAFNMTLRRMKRTGLTPHGFRSSFRDWAEERTNFPNAVVEAALAHSVKDKVEAAYRRTTLFEKRRELLATWEAFATARPGGVVQLRAKAN